MYLFNIFNFIRKAEVHNSSRIRSAFLRNDIVQIKHKIIFNGGYKEMKNECKPKVFVQTPRLQSGA